MIRKVHPFPPMWVIKMPLDRTGDKEYIHRGFSSRAHYGNGVRYAHSPRLPHTEFLLN
jgi:hypothetical protein